MKNVLDIKESIPMLYGIGYILTFILNTVVWLMGYLMLAVMGLVEGFNYLYAFVVGSLVMMPFPINLLVFYFFISFIPLILIFLLLVMMHHAFSHESFGNDKMTISPLYILSPTKDQEPVRYPNKACENFSHSIIMWILFLHIFILVSVLF